MLTPRPCGSSTADYYRKSSLGAEKRHIIPEVNSGPGKSTSGSNFHNYLLSKGIRKGRIFLHCRVGEGKLEPGLRMFISQPAAFSVNDTGALRLRGPDKQGFRYSGKKGSGGGGDNVEEGEHPFPLKKGRHEDL